MDSQIEPVEKERRHMTLRFILNEQDPVCENPVFKDAPLVQAAYTCQEKWIKIYLRRNMDLNQQDKAGRTALYVAAARGYNDIVNLLLESRPDVDRPAKDGSTALMLAIINGHLEVAIRLYDYGAKATARSYDDKPCLSVDGQTPLSLVIKSSEISGFKDLAMKMYENTSLTEILELGIAGHITLFEAYVDVHDFSQDYRYYARLSERIKVFDAEARSANPETNVLEKWNNCPLLPQLIAGLTSPIIQEGEEKISEIRRKDKIIPPIGLEFRKKYMLVKYLGNGSFSIAWKVMDLSTGAYLAAKFPMRTTDEKDRRAAISEAKLMRFLNHPNVMQYLSFSSGDGYPIMVTELATGGDLCKYLNKHRDSMKESDAKKIFRQLAEGLAYMHAKNVAHQDLKPGNILCFDDGNVKIADLGNSLQLQAPTHGISKLAGTYQYCPPEAVRARKQKSCFAPKPCDIWALGVILYELLVGRLPWDPQHLAEHPDRKAYYKELNRLILDGDLHLDDSSWNGIEIEAIHLVNLLLEPDASGRPNAAAILRHPWMDEKSKGKYMLNLENLRVPRKKREVSSPGPDENLRAPKRKRDSPSPGPDAKKRKGIKS
ncbi:uncharacterized protein RSE6_01602 [Rhynchosporium secalis]|uniref:Protein kinase domain-containing protein n=1 Tax=Rhynchosporium secalis TaxID=38038 RepID=A0A1E1LY90_RHYSE|nr:uncharacterized protein RSE6_01602 [Rhynchosporium secalis]